MLLLYPSVETHKLIDCPNRVSGLQVRVNEFVYKDTIIIMEKMNTEPKILMPKLEF